MDPYIEQFFEILNAIYWPSDIVMSVIFFYTTSFLRMFTVSVILVLTIAKICTIKGTKIYIIIKYITYIWFFGYSIYTLGIIENIQNVNILDWTTFAFSVIAPFCMLILGKQAGNMKIKGHKIFVYPVYMIIYIIISAIWWFYVPESANFTVLFVVWIIVFVSVSILDYIV